MMMPVDLEQEHNLLALFRSITPLEWEMIAESFYEVEPNVWLDIRHCKKMMVNPQVRADLWSLLQLQLWHRLLTLGAPLRKWRRIEKEIVRQLADGAIVAEWLGLTFTMEEWGELSEALRAHQTLYDIYRSYVVILWRLLLKETA